MLIRCHVCHANPLGRWKQSRRLSSSTPTRGAPPAFTSAATMRQRERRARFRCGKTTIGRKAGCDEAFPLTAETEQTASDDSRSIPDDVFDVTTHQDQPERKGQTLKGQGQ